MVRRITFALIFLTTACTGKPRIPADTLVVALGAEPVTLDPRFATDAYGMRIAGLVFSSIVHLGPGLKPEPDAAEKWSAAKRRFTFELRPGLKFDNGRDILPEDVEYSFAEYMKPGRPFATILEVIQSVKATQAQGHIRLVIELKTFSAGFLTAVLPIVKLLPKAEAQGDRFVPIGSGAYKYVSHDANQITLESVRGKTKYIKFKIIRDDFTRYLKTLNGEIDINQGEMAFDKVPDFENRAAQFTVYKNPGLSMAYLVINFKDPVLKQKRVRLALMQALERQEIIRYKLQGLAQEATSILTPDNPYFNAELKNPPFDLKAARDTIEKLGLTGHEISLKTSNAAASVDHGRVIAHQLGRTGLKFNLQSFEWATYYDDIKKGRFQLATMRWVGIVDPDFYRQVFHSSELPPGRNRGAYANPDLDALLQRGFAEEDDSRRRKIYAQVQKIVQDDIAMIPLWYDQQIAITKKTVQNYRPQQTGDYWPLIEATKTQ